MRKGVSLIFLLSILMYACSSNKTEDTVRTTVYPMEIKVEAKFSDIFEKISYTSLKIPYHLNITKIDKAIFTGDHYLIGDYLDGLKIFIFNQQGELKGLINNYGEGPGEYTAILNFVFDSINNQIEVLTVERIIKFDLEGNFLEEFKLPIKIENFIVTGQNEYLAFIPPYIFNESLPNGGKDFDLFSMDLEEKNIDPIVPDVFSQKAFHFIEKGNLFVNGNDSYFSTTSVDTIYKIVNAKLEQKIVLDFGKFQLNPKDFHGLSSQQKAFKRNQEEFINKTFWHYPHLSTDGNTLITTYLNRKGYKLTVVELDQGKAWTSPSWINDIDGGLEWFNSPFIFENSIFSFMSNEVILDHYNKKNWNGSTTHFTELAENLSDELVVIKHELRK
ncbi:6-bladed beta-propeller [Mongoliitalea daihaiensis]|uniref:6-bladed beta-propeller n=1 Tax=Mongoliitalea daihaiensis TaxID=2782006 RepID=UPI001F23D842|nr:6-bladed beta-propeller [Mongoliitalea daihaiensis]UJP66157.1 6-bladed beta-propeller [Mongoliitalea daihaiensis]